MHAAVGHHQARPGQAEGLLAADVHQLRELGAGQRRSPQQPLDRIAQRVLERARARAALDAEDARHDHVERDRLHARRERERPADRPARDLALGGIGDHLLVARDRLAVKGRQQQFALAQVARTVGGQHRARPEHGAQRRLLGERRHLLGWRREKRAHVVGVAGDRRAPAHVALRAPHFAELAAVVEDEIALALSEPQHLHRPRPAYGRRARQLRELRGLDRAGRRGWRAADQLVGGVGSWDGGCGEHVHRASVSLVRAPSAARMSARRR